MKQNNDHKGAEEMPLTKEESDDLDKVCDEVYRHRVVAMEKRLKESRKTKSSS